MPISYNITKLIPTILDPNIHNPDADKLVYFCDSYNLTLTKEDTWIDQISSGYRCGKHLLKKQYYNITSSNDDNIEPDHIYSNGETKTEDDNDYPTASSQETPSNEEISFSIFTESGGNMTTITYPCFKIEEIFENNTLWTLNIGRAILCGIQTPLADSIILESKQKELEQQANDNIDGGKSGSNSNGNVATSNSAGAGSTRSGISSNGRTNSNNGSIQTTKVIMTFCLIIFFSIL